MNTIPLESMGNESTAQNMTAANTATLRESIETTTVFDTKKWKKMINGNVDMIQRKVDHIIHNDLSIWQAQVDTKISDIESQLSEITVGL